MHIWANLKLVGLKNVTEQFQLKLLKVTITKIRTVLKDPFLKVTVNTESERASHLSSSLKVTM